MFDLIIIGFACISIMAFTITKDNHKKTDNVQIQSGADTGN
tara:strand:+ start:449 stop:571 length:123 start_codon:yes stop_codon:yes gene_type:complete